SLRQHDLVDVDGRPPPALRLRDLVSHALELRLGRADLLLTVEERDPEALLLVSVKQHQPTLRVRDAVRLDVLANAREQVIDDRRVDVLKRGDSCVHLSTSNSWTVRAYARRGRRSSTDRKSTRLNSSHLGISYAVFCL